MPMGGGKYFSNPQVARRYEQDSQMPPAKGPAIGKGGGGHGHPPAHTVAVHKAGGRFHSLGHHDGGVHMQEHGSADEAHEYAKQCMGSDQDGEMDQPEMPKFGSEGY